MAKLHYWICFPEGRYQPYADKETDVVCIAKTKKAVQESQKNRRKSGEKISSSSNEIKEFESDIEITGDNVWVLFHYDKEDPNWASVEFVGNSYEECLGWWSENYEDYTSEESFDEDDNPMAPEFEAFGSYFIWSDDMHGMIIKEMPLS